MLQKPPSKILAYQHLWQNSHRNQQYQEPYQAVLLVLNGQLRCSRLVAPNFFEGAAATQHNGLQVVQQPCLQVPAYFDLRPSVPTLVTLDPWLAGFLQDCPLDARLQFQSWI